MNMKYAVNKWIMKIHKVENRWDKSRFVRNRIPYFPVHFHFSGINRNGTENGSGTENGGAFVRPYLRNPVFDRDIPFCIPFFIHPG